MGVEKIIHGGASAALVWVALLALAGCEGSGQVKPDKPLLDTGAFSHEVHLASGGAVASANKGAQLECKTCHAIGDRFAVLRPGQDQHAPCDTCHADAFYQPPGALCGTCHKEVNPLQEGASPVYAYPRRERVAQLLSRFDHALHLDGAQVKGANGALQCASCHQVGSGEDAYASFPTHEACAPCHASAKEGGQGVAPLMDACSSCHAQNGPGKARRFIQNDIRFTHGKHVRDASGKEIACESCHYAVRKSTTSYDTVLPVMADCARCHEDSSRTPDRVRIAQCGVCHTGAVDSVKLPGNHTAAREVKPEGRALTLRDLTPNGEQLLADKDGVVPVQQGKLNPAKRPDDHTPIFRSRHAEAASSRDAKCGYCHTGLSGSSRDACTDCHATMRPRSHTLRFRNTEHGRLAAMNARACATCHEVDFCTECHKIAPPNHSPLTTFRYRHERAARFNPRSCMTCHTFEATCQECHLNDIAPSPVPQPLQRGASPLNRRLP